MRARGFDILRLLLRRTIYRIIFTGVAATFTMRAPHAVESLPLPTITIFADDDDGDIAAIV